MSSINLTHHFLIAMPSMADPHFAHTLIYICEHNENGALGIVINKPIDMTLSALFEQINVPLGDSELREARVHYGGPVQTDRGFVLHEPAGNWQSTLRVRDAIG
ncbi:MAG TPA: YqgE/AlgH family protein, partial [Burkholderiales bacterium]|nr:YqgE/AlgH family protein [Burkholderiales bacterium]